MAANVRSGGVRQPQPRSARQTVLLVDDHPGVLHALSRALSRGPYRLVQTTDPREAVRMLSLASVDVIIADIEMPQMNGLELMEVARRVRPSAVRIIVSGVGTVEATTRAINSGEVHRFVHKPFEPAILRTIVDDALERQRELLRTSEASLAADRRRLLLEQLEEEYAGITEIERDPQGAYLLDELRARSCANSIGLIDFLREETPTELGVGR